MNKILGIDPGSSVAGFACLARTGEGIINARNMKILGAGALKFDKNLSHSKRIGQLHNSVYKLLEEFNPDFCVIEKGFLGVNPNTSLKLGESRGAIISAVYRSGVELREITPAQVKKFMTGSGRASKEEIAQSLKQLLGFELGDLPHDVSDAIAIALAASFDCAAPKQVSRMHVSAETPV